MCNWKSMAGIVTYNPDLERLIENVSAIYNQVSEVIIVDNHSVNAECLEQMRKEFPKLVVINNSENYGIAKALNQIVLYAKTHNYQWVVSLDQDSVVEGDLISRYDNFLNKHNDDNSIAMITSLRKDRNYDIDMVYTKEYEFVDRCITSASYANVDILIECGLYDESMFIDYVDYDICASIIESNFRIVRLNELGFLHELGKSRRVRFFFKTLVVYNESPIRKYYYTRNILYYLHKHNRVVNKSYEFKQLIKVFLLTLLYEDNKKNKLFSMIKGIKDSRKMIKNSINN